MSKTYFVVSTIVLTTVLLAAPRAEAQRGFRGRGGGSCCCLLGTQAVEALGLNHDQQDRIEDLYEEMMDYIEPLLDELDKKDGILRSLWASNRPDKGKIDALQREMEVLRQRIRDQRARFRGEASKLLTPLQREKYQDLMKAGQCGRGYGQGGGRGYGRGYRRGRRDGSGYGRGRGGGRGGGWGWQ